MANLGRDTLGRQTCPLPIPRSSSLMAASTWGPTLGMDCSSSQETSSTTEIPAGKASSWSLETAQRRFLGTAVATANLTAPFLPQQLGTPTGNNCPISEA